MKCLKQFPFYLVLSLCLYGNPGLYAQADQDLILSFDGHKGPVFSLAIHPDGKTIATGGEDMLIHLWDPLSGEIKKTLEGHTKPVKYLSYSKDGSTF